MFESNPFGDLALQVDALVLEFFQDAPLLAGVAQRRDIHMRLLEIRRDIHGADGDQDGREIDLAQEDHSEFALEDFADPFEAVFHRKRRGGIRPPSRLRYSCWAIFSSV